MLDSDVRFQHRSSSPFAGARVSPGTSLLPAAFLFLTTVQGRQTNAACELLAAHTLRFLRFLDPGSSSDAGATASQRLTSRPTESSRTSSLTGRHVPQQSILYQLLFFAVVLPTCIKVPGFLQMKI
ncbi:hypothetical protein NDU88_005191 [Pleurodeles waltl]|uniref:Uncharacterized protein n=1 Tax=Pleurodeles waltl TaxID=8319 RepID=A0AAV7RIY9_PLEWA|nr:hypothetical protein NDU88_005191 [Pleurodeles waltl]